MIDYLFPFISLIPLAFLSAVLVLFSLSLVTPWTRRKKNYFLTPRYNYHPQKQLNSAFPCLISWQDEAFRRTEPEIHLSVVVPAMNEEKRLPAMLDECLEFLENRLAQNAELTYEVIVVDDGSKDETAGVAHAYSSSHPVFVLQLPENIGKGGAVREGVLCSRGKFVMFADADGATRFADLEKLEQRMHVLCNGEDVAGNAPTDWTHPALVVGSRAHLEKDSIARRSFIRTGPVRHFHFKIHTANFNCSVLMIGFHTLVWIFTVRTVRDTQCGFKMFSRAAAAKLFTQMHIEKWAFDVELIYMAEQLHYSIGEVAVEWTEIDGSKVTPLFSWLQMGRDILLIWFRYAVGIWRTTQKTEE